MRKATDALEEFRRRRRAYEAGMVALALTAFFVAVALWWMVLFLR